MRRRRTSIHMQDPLPTWLLFGSVNSSLSLGYFRVSSSQESRSQCIDAVRLLTSFELAFPFKGFESAIRKQMTEYLLRNNLLPKLQSANRHGRSTDTTLFNVFSDIVDIMNQGNLLLFLSTCPQHSIL